MKQLKRFLALMLSVCMLIGMPAFSSGVLGINGLVTKAEAAEELIITNAEIISDNSVKVKFSHEVEIGSVATYVRIVNSNYELQFGDPSSPAQWPGTITLNDADKSEATINVSGSFAEIYNFIKEGSLFPGCMVCISFEEQGAVDGTNGMVDTIHKAGNSSVLLKGVNTWGDGADGAYYDLVTVLKKLTIVDEDTLCLEFSGNMSAPADAWTSIRLVDSNYSTMMLKDAGSSVYDAGATAVVGGSGSGGYLQWRCEFDSVNSTGNKLYFNVVTENNDWQKISEGEYVNTIYEILTLAQTEFAKGLIPVFGRGDGDTVTDGLCDTVFDIRGSKVKATGSFGGGGDHFYTLLSPVPELISAEYDKSDASRLILTFSENVYANSSVGCFTSIRYIWNESWANGVPYPIPVQELINKGTPNTTGIPDNGYLQFAGRIEEYGQVGDNKLSFKITDKATIAQAVSYVSKGGGMENYFIPTFHIEERNDNNGRIDSIVNENGVGVKYSHINDSQAIYSEISTLAYLQSVTMKDADSLLLTFSENVTQIAEPYTAIRVLKNAYDYSFLGANDKGEIDYWNPESYPYALQWTGSLSREADDKENQLTFNLNAGCENHFNADTLLEIAALFEPGGVLNGYVMAFAREDTSGITNDLLVDSIISTQTGAAVMGNTYDRFYVSLANTATVTKVTGASIVNSKTIRLSFNNPVNDTVNSVNPNEGPFTYVRAVDNYNSLLWLDADNTVTATPTVMDRPLQWEGKFDKTAEDTDYTLTFTFHDTQSWFGADDIFEILDLYEEGGALHGFKLTIGREDGKYDGNYFDETILDNKGWPVRSEAPNNIYFNINNINDPVLLESVEVSEEASKLILNFSKPVNVNPYVTSSYTSLRFVWASDMENGTPRAVAVSELKGAGIENKTGIPETTDTGVPLYLQYTGRIVEYGQPSDNQLAFEILDKASIAQALALVSEGGCLKDSMVATFEMEERAADDGDIDLIQDLSGNGVKYTHSSDKGAVYMPINERLDYVTSVSIKDSNSLVLTFSNNVNLGSDFSYTFIRVVNNTVENVLLGADEYGNVGALDGTNYPYALQWTGQLSRQAGDGANQLTFALGDQAGNIEGHYGANDIYEIAALFEKGGRLYGKALVVGREDTTGNTGDVLLDTVTSASTGYPVIATWGDGYADRLYYPINNLFELAVLEHVSVNSDDTTLTLTFNKNVKISDAANLKMFNSIRLFNNMTDQALVFDDNGVLSLSEEGNVPLQYPGELSDNIKNDNTLTFTMSYGTKVSDVLALVGESGKYKGLTAALCLQDETADTGSNTLFEAIRDENNIPAVASKSGYYDTLTYQLTNSVASAAPELISAVKLSDNEILTRFSRMVGNYGGYTGYIRIMEGTTVYKEFSMTGVDYAYSQGLNFHGMIWQISNITIDEIFEMAEEGQSVIFCIEEGEGNAVNGKVDNFYDYISHPYFDNNNQAPRLIANSVINNKENATVPVNTSTLTLDNVYIYNDNVVVMDFSEPVNQVGNYTSEIKVYDEQGIERESWGVWMKAYLGEDKIWGNIMEPDGVTYQSFDAIQAYLANKYPEGNITMKFKLGDFGTFISGNGLVDDYVSRTTGSPLIATHPASKDYVLCDVTEKVNESMAAIVSAELETDSTLIVTFSEPVTLDPGYYTAIRLVDENGYLAWTDDETPLPLQFTGYLEAIPNDPVHFRYVMSVNDFGVENIQDILDFNGELEKYSQYTPMFCIEEAVDTTTPGDGLVENIKDAAGNCMSATLLPRDGWYDGAYIGIGGVTDFTKVKVESVHTDNDLEVIVKFSEPVNFTGNPFMSVRMVDETGTLVWDGGQWGEGVPMQWPGNWIYNNEERTEIRWTIYSVLMSDTYAIGNLTDLFTYAKDLEKFEDKGYEFLFCIEELPEGGIFGANGHVDNIRSAVDDRSRLIANKIGGYDGVYSEIDITYNLEKLEMSVTAINPRQLYVQFSDPVKVAGDPFLALRYVDSENNLLWTDGEENHGMPLQFYGTWEWANREQTALIWTMNQANTYLANDLNDVFNYANGLKKWEDYAIKFCIEEKTNEALTVHGADNLVHNFYADGGRRHLYGQRLSGYDGAYEYVYINYDMTELALESAVSYKEDSVLLTFTKKPVFDADALYGIAYMDNGGGFIVDGTGRNVKFFGSLEYANEEGTRLLWTINEDEETTVKEILGFEGSFKEFLGSNIKFFIQEQHGGVQLNICDKHICNVTDETGVIKLNATKISDADELYMDITAEYELAVPEGSVVEPEAEVITETETIYTSNYLWVILTCAGILLLGVLLGLIAKKRKKQ